MLINRETGRSASSYDLEDSTFHPCVVSKDQDDCIEHLMEKNDCYEMSKKDGRLFHEYPLYCEGHPKPVCRGVLHLVYLTEPPYLT